MADAVEKGSAERLGRSKPEISDESHLTKISDPECISRSHQGNSPSSPHPHLSSESATIEIPETNLEAGIIGWDGQDDPNMPLNFSRSRKWTLLSLVAIITFISPLASSMFSPGVGFMDEEFGNTSVILSSLSISIYVLGFAIGPLFLAPLSEIYGRRPILGAANVFFSLWQVGCALAPNLQSLIIFRFLAGVGGSGCLTLGGGVISDLFVVEERGLATSIYTLGPLIGPVVGPVCGGFVAQQAGWRWVFWIVFIASASVTVLIELLNRETYQRVIISSKTTRLRKELNREELRSCYEDGNPRKKLEIIRQSIYRPFKILFGSPIVFILSLYMALIYGLLYLLFTTITSVFEHTYHFTPGITGLAYMGIGIGNLLGLVLVAKTSDKSVRQQMKENNGIFEPEMRLPTMIFYAPLLPIGLFWYGWTADKAVHWIVPMIGLVPFGFGMICIFIPIQTYIIDSFPVYAASALAALTVSRSLFGAVLPLAGPAMYDSLGLGWGNSLLGFIALIMIPAPFYIWKYGGGFRKKSRTIA